MGIYLNPNNIDFRRAINSEISVDKSMLIEQTNKKCLPSNNISASADLILIPRRNVISPAIIVELKFQSSAETAIEQIKNKNYTDCLKDYSGKILLVEISYDKDKKRRCVIETVNK